VLWTLFVVLVVLWVLGYAGGYLFGGLLHILLVVAALALIVHLGSGRRMI
jgi:hypothetical protein